MAKQVGDEAPDTGGTVTQFFTSLNVFNKKWFMYQKTIWQKQIKDVRKFP